MPTVFDKLNLKDQTDIVVLNAPESFEPELARLRGVNVRRKLTGAGRVSFALTFVTTQEQVDDLARRVTNAAEGDAVVWFAYPKGTSKRYKSEIKRDNGWKALGDAGFEGVRMVAIDEDWSAVRFRRVDYIKTMNRHPSGAMTARGKARTAGEARARRS
jgi:hypothetical protein